MKEEDVSRELAWILWKLYGIFFVSPECLWALHHGYTSRKATGDLGRTKAGRAVCPWPARLDINDGISDTMNHTIRPCGRRLCSEMLGVGSMAKKVVSLATRLVTGRDVWQARRGPRNTPARPSTCHGEVETRRTLGAALLVGRWPGRPQRALWSVPGEISPPSSCSGR